MREKLSPKVDIVFKKLFGVEENKDLLISLINSVVSTEDQVADVDILNPYNVQDFRNDKLSVLDIKARGHNGKRYNIEIQISNEADYDKRALYYWAKLYTEQLQRGADYSTLNKAIGIHILNFISIPESKKYHHVFNLRDKETGIHYFENMELHTIELSKFEGSSALSGVNVSDATFIAKIKTSLDMWVAFLIRCDLLKDLKDQRGLPDKEVENLKKALDVLEVMDFTDAERNSYEEHLKWLRMESNTLKKSFEDGEKKGKAEGKAEIAKTLEIAKSLIAKGMDTKLIAEVTGLSEEEIQKLCHTLTNS